jgi:hypothetical protein
LLVTRVNDNIVHYPYTLYYSTLLQRNLFITPLPLPQNSSATSSGNSVGNNNRNIMILS